MCACDIFVYVYMCMYLYIPTCMNIRIYMYMRITDYIYVHASDALVSIYILECPSIYETVLVHFEYRMDIQIYVFLQFLQTYHGMHATYARVYVRMYVNTYVYMNECIGILIFTYTFIH